MGLLKGCLSEFMKGWEKIFEGIFYEKMGE